MWRLFIPGLIFLGLTNGALAQTIAEEPTAAELPEDIQASLSNAACREALNWDGADLTALTENIEDLKARIASEPTCQSSHLAEAPDADALTRLEALERELAEVRANINAETARYDALATELAALRQELTGVASLPLNSPDTVASAPAASAPQITYIPGAGVAIPLGESQLNIAAEVSLLGSLSTRRPVIPANPLFLSPTDPGTTFDLTARQSKLRIAFSGPQIGDFTTGASAMFTLSDSLTAEGYSFAPVVAYADLTSDRWRFAAGLQYDLFTPRDPRVIPTTLLADSGNPGAYRAQARAEYFIRPSDDFQTTLQFAISAPISTSVDSPSLGNLRLVEDNGWPNLEGRVNVGFGTPRSLAGDRTLRPAEVGLSGVVGQLRTIDRNADLTERQAITDVWGLGLDTHVAFTDRLGFSGEFYVGQGLGEYLAGINQSFNTETLEAVSTLGGWGELYYYFNDTLHWHVGYGIDTANDSSLINQNQTLFSNLIWNLNPQLQLSFEADYRITDYVQFGSKDGWIFLSEILWRL